LRRELRLQAGNAALTSGSELLPVDVRQQRPYGSHSGHAKYRLVEVARRSYVAEQ
jgi:hypothetical protein